MYLNAEVYTGTPMYDKAATYAKKVIDAGFGLEDNYANLFCGENHLIVVSLGFGEPCHFVVVIRHAGSFARFGRVGRYASRDRFLR